MRKFGKYIAFNVTPLTYSGVDFFTVVYSILLVCFCRNFYKTPKRSHWCKRLLYGVIFLLMSEKFSIFANEEQFL